MDGRLLVIPNSFSLGMAHQAFDEQRLLRDANADTSVRGVGAALVKAASNLHGPRAVTGP
jgi:chromate reductase